ncbi:MAG: Glu-tRNA(Gln) amidotransferase subunit GatD [Candidatus Hadarchaeota archaeon]
MSSYKGVAGDVLEPLSADIGDRIRIKKENQVFEGLLMPRTSGESNNYLVIKLDNGYNVGIKINQNVEIEKLSEGSEPEIGKKTEKVEVDPGKPKVSIIGTGGTVASKVDYRTGAVHPAFSAEEIYNSAPEIAEIANIKTETACNVLSENMTPELWDQIAEKIYKELNEGAKGVVVAHGTDTMGYTAAALSFMFEDLSKPIVLVGSQRSSDRPSSDAPLNMVSAVSTAVSDLGEVCVVMHGSTQDEFCLIHRGTKARKCHTSRRDAFQSIDQSPLGIVKDGEVRYLCDKKDRGTQEIKLKKGFEEKVVLLKVYPNMGSETIKKLIEEGYKGIVLEGTGLGHTPKSLHEGLEMAKEEEIPVGMTSQCIWGRINMRVYSSGRDLLDLGVFSLGDMLPETAYVKMMWILDKTTDIDEVKSLMSKNLAGEKNERTEIDSFLKPKMPEEKNG